MMNGLYNVGTGFSRPWEDLANVVIENVKMPKGLPRSDLIEYIPMHAELNGKYQSYTRADITRLAEAGYPCDTILSLEEGVGHYVNGYLKQGNKTVGW